MSRRARRWWPRTLFARLTLILCGGLALATALSFQLVMYERTQAGTAMMLGYLDQDLASAVTLLERLPAAQRADWLPHLARTNYSLLLDPGVGGPAPASARARRVLDSIGAALGARQFSANLVPGNAERLQLHLRLKDGSPLTIDLRLRGMPLSPWLPLVLLAQLALICGCTWFAVRLATRPLAQLAQAADTLGPDYMSERMQILAAISHDWQTPITRMRMRADMMEEGAHGTALRRDLLEMEALVREGVTYAKTLHATAEPTLRIDPDALLDSMQCDYADAGHAVTLEGRVGSLLVARPQALRRILSNLIDNALKFTGAAEVRAQPARAGQVTITVSDRGAGIPEDQLEAVFQPFFRLESSRNRASGGTGLGLAIARQLANAMNATLTLHPRSGGGLEARLTLATDDGKDGG